MKDLSEVMFMKVAEPAPLKNDVRHVISDNPNYHPYEGELTETSPQNTQLSRVWGYAAELAFEACFYEWVKTEDLQLVPVPLDKGFDRALLNLKIMELQDLNMVISLNLMKSFLIVGRSNKSSLV